MSQLLLKKDGKPQWTTISKEKFGKDGYLHIFNIGEDVYVLKNLDIKDYNFWVNNLGMAASGAAIGALLGPIGAVVGGAAAVTAFIAKTEMDEGYYKLDPDGDGGFGDRILDQKVYKDDMSIYKL